MERLYTNIIGTPVFEDEAKRPTTAVRDVVLDPETGKVLAVVVNPHKNLILTPMDIMSWKEVIRIRDQEVIVDGSEVLRVEHVQKSGIRYFHNKVETKSGKYLGKVLDFSLNLDTGEIRKLHVSKGFLGLIRYESRIIPVNNIIEVLSEKIIVKNDFETVKEKAKSESVVKDLAMG